MRTSDKKKNIKKANILVESLYRQRNNEDFDYAASEREYHDRQDYEHDLKLEELGQEIQEALLSLRGDWSVKKVNYVYLITNAAIPNREMEIGLSTDRNEFKDDEYKYYYELKSVNPNSNPNPAINGHQGNHILEKSRTNNPANLFISGKHPYEMWFM